MPAALMLSCMRLLAVSKAPEPLSETLAPAALTLPLIAILKPATFVLWNAASLMAEAGTVGVGLAAGFGVVRQAARVTAGGGGGRGERGRGGGSGTGC